MYVEGVQRADAPECRAGSAVVGPVAAQRVAVLPGPAAAGSAGVPARYRGGGGCGPGSSRGQTVCAERAGPVTVRVRSGVISRSGPSCRFSASNYL